MDTKIEEQKKDEPRRNPKRKNKYDKDYNDDLTNGNDNDDGDDIEPPKRNNNDRLIFFINIPEHVDEFPNKKQKLDVIDSFECRNPLCDHRTFIEDPTKIKQYDGTKISNIRDLIDLGKTFHCKKNLEYNGINLRLLCNLIQPLTELNKMVGMESVKTSMVDQILYFLQGFNKNERCNNCIDCTFKLPCALSHDDMLHTIITGPPGVGKTELGKILGKVYKEMGIISKGHFNLVTRSDLVGKYLGHTAAKTQKKIDECSGGIMFIDEAYALGNPENRDSFSKECIDTINQNLTEKKDWLCIIAGYEKSLDKCVFKVNEGLRRRFTFRYNIEKYNYEELMKIFLLKVSKGNWYINYEFDKHETKKNLLNFFKKNYNQFPNFGGDMETLFLNCKIAHSRRILFDNPINKRKLSLEDISDGYEILLKNRKYKNPSTNDSLWH